MDEARTRRELIDAALLHYRFGWHHSSEFVAGNVVWEMVLTRPMLANAANDARLGKPRRRESPS